MTTEVTKADIDEFEQALAELEDWDKAQAASIARDSVFEDICAGFAAWRAYDPETYRPRMTIGGPLTFIDYWRWCQTREQH